MAWTPARNSQEPGLVAIPEKVEYASQEGIGKRLPVDHHKDAILDHINKYRVTCIQGDTGSGKSTRVPQYIVEQYMDKRVKWDVETPRIVVTQPRRIAAKSLAKRVAGEMGEKIVGGKVGYKIGQEQNASPDTMICYVTSGYLIELLVHNPESFDKYTHIILDEIHERDLDADLLSLMVNLLMEKYLKPKVIIMSATLQVELFLEYFSEEGRELLQGPGASIDKKQLLTISTKSDYGITTCYLEELYQYCMDNGIPVSSDCQKLIVETYCYFQQIDFQQLLSGECEEPVSRKMQTLAEAVGIRNLRKDNHEADGMVKPIEKYIKLGVLIVQATAIPTGSILIFLPGISEIEKLYDLLLPYEDEVRDGWNSKITLFTLHSKMPFEDQQECFRDPEDSCHVILATNMAESSVTLPNVSVVIDFAQRRHLVYHQKKRISVLKLSWCSQASMNQRKGRTGRVCDGLCFRVMTENHFDKQSKFDPAQMKLAPLDTLVLKVKYVGDHISPDESPSDLLAQAIEPPSTDSIDTAVKNLADIGALSGNDENSEVTLLGKFCMDVPLDLYLCRLVFFGAIFNCPCDAIVMASALQSEDPFKQPSNKVFKNTERFVRSQKKSYDARKKYDDLTYSEPIMYRNMFRDWCQQVLEEEERRREDGDTTTRSKRDKREMKTFRNQFGKENEVDAKRLQLLEGVIDDVAKATAKWFDPNCPQRESIDILLKLLPRNRDKFASVGMEDCEWRPMDDETDELQTLFKDNYMMLYMVLAGTFVPRFLYGNIKGSGVSFKTKLTKAGLEPRNSIVMTKLPRDITSNDEITKMLIRNISLETNTQPSGMSRTSSDDQFKFHVQGEELMVEFKSEDMMVPKNEEYKERTITDDVHICVQRAFQFTENPGGHENEKVFNYLLPKSSAQRMSDKVKIGMVQNPFRLEWKFMSQDGSPLFTIDRNGQRQACNGSYERWRNPGGFICDVHVNKHGHFGVGYDTTFNEKGTRCWVKGITLFPTYRENLFAMAIMLAFIPQQHGVRFKINTKKKAISEVHLFEHKLPIQRGNPLTEKLMKVVNRIRQKTSDIFGNKEALRQNRFPYTDLDKHFHEFMLNLQVGDLQQLGKHACNDNEEVDSNLPLHVIVNGFHKMSDRHIVYERCTLSKNVYLEPYNTDLLFKKESLERYVEQNGRSSSDDEAESLEQLLGLIMKF